MLFPPTTLSFFQKHIAQKPTLDSINQQLEVKTGIISFFENTEAWESFIADIQAFKQDIVEPERAAYGDFQTPPSLALAVCKYLQQKNIQPTILLEPTCGKGHFLVQALATFDSLNCIYAIEIYRPYILEAKLNILHFYLQNEHSPSCKIHFFHANIFDFNFAQLQKQLQTKEQLLILGNPPWVTNAKLSTLDSDNLPPKSNFKQLTGLDAITGKSNFDIAEYISILLLQHFSGQKGHFALLLKNNAIKNLVWEQKKRQIPIAHLEKAVIDAKKEFNVATAASLFYAQLKQTAATTCLEKDFYENEKTMQTFGWAANQRFVSNTAIYQKYQAIDGQSPFVWRSGMKHDCSKVFELTKQDGQYQNKLKERFDLEENLVYPILKSSFLKKAVIEDSDRFVIITQQKIGQSTAYIQIQYPQTYAYLKRHADLLNNRKSVIYKNKPPFSIFGIGNYSFQKYKVAISGLYKKGTFSLILPKANKPILLDDTCYFLSFDELSTALFTYLLLTHPITKAFLQSIIFLDSKRVYTKDLLMRIDLKALTQQLSFEELLLHTEALEESLKQLITKGNWEQYLNMLNPQNISNQQLKLSF